MANIYRCKLNLKTAYIYYFKYNSLTVNEQKKIIYNKRFG